VHPVIRRLPRTGVLRMFGPPADGA